jgi:nucleoid DNA-binding protein
MNTIDLINKVSANNTIATGRAEMIISIIIEKIIDKLRREGTVVLEDFGTFTLETKDQSANYMIDYGRKPKFSVVFSPNNKFLDVVNT